MARAGEQIALLCSGVKFGMSWSAALLVLMSYCTQFYSEAFPKCINCKIHSLIPQCSAATVQIGVKLLYSVGLTVSVLYIMWLLNLAGNQARNPRTSLGTFHSRSVRWSVLLKKQILLSPCCVSWTPSFKNKKKKCANAKLFRLFVSLTCHFQLGAVHRVSVSIRELFYKL